MVNLIIEVQDESRFCMPLCQRTVLSGLLVNNIYLDTGNLVFVYTHNDVWVLSEDSARS